MPLIDAMRVAAITMMTTTTIRFIFVESRTGRDYVNDHDRRGIYWIRCGEVCW